MLYIHMYVYHKHNYNYWNMSFLEVAYTGWNGSMMLRKQYHVKLGMLNYRDKKKTQNMGKLTAIYVPNLSLKI